MPTTRPRVYVTLDDDIYREAEKQAKQKRVSLSLILRDRLRKAMEWEETFEVLRDNKTMRDIQNSLREIQEGKRGTPWREVLKNV